MRIDISQFSSREKETIDLLLQGKSNKQIALALGVSVSTVEFHLKNIYRKLQVKSRTEAILQLGESIGGITDKQRESIVAGIGVKVENDENTIPKRRIPMKQWFFIIGGSLLAIALAATVFFVKFNIDQAQRAPQPTQLPEMTGKAISFPTETQAVATEEISLPTETPEIAGTVVSFANASFTIPPSLGNRTLNEYIPESKPGDVVDIMALYPGHLRFILEDYPLRDKTAQPEILIFPAPEFAQMSDCSKARIDGLKKILAEQRISPVMPDTCSSVVDEIPILPDRYAKQLFHAQEKFLVFKNGTGIRYITQYTQAAFPAINNTDIFYTFQGLTSDGKYYVSVILPITLPDLAADDDPEAWRHPAEWQTPEKYPEYVKTTVEKLNQADNQFGPSLESLDALAQSVLVADQQ